MSSPKSTKSAGEPSDPSQSPSQRHSQRHFLKTHDLTKAEIQNLLFISKRVKNLKKNGTDHQVLSGKVLANIFQKPSNRTRVSFEVGMYQLGGKTVHISGAEISMGEREPISDVAKVLSRYVDIIMIRPLLHGDIEEFASNSEVPVINGLSDLYHPCQALADLLTIEEHFGSLRDIKVCYLGDGNNVCNSLIDTCRSLDVDIVVSCPEGYDPKPNSSSYEIERDPIKATKDAHVIYTDTWVSMGMGQEKEYEKRLEIFKPYAVTGRTMQNAAKNAIFLHCLPAHRGEEVSKDVIDGSASRVFEQAENRLHTEKAVLCWLLEKHHNL